MKKENRHHYLLVAFGVILFVGLLHLSSIFSWISNVINVLMPVVFGFIVGFILNVPMRAIERLIDKLPKKKDKGLNPKLKRGLSFAITIIILLGVVTLLVVVVSPKLVDSVISIYNLIMSNWTEIIKFLEELGIDASLVQSWMDKLDIKEIIQALSKDTIDLFDVVFNFVGSTVSGIISLLVGFVIAIYVLLGKENIINGTKKLVLANCNEKRSNFIFKTCKLVDEKYTKFLSGQCVEACILGLLMFIVFKILGIPYASLIAVLTAFCAFVPYVGAFLSCFIGAVLIMLVDPSKVIIYVIAYLVTQFVENQFIYPHVVGTSVGLNALWTIIAVFIGGKILGLFGMIFFIPLVAVIVTLINEYTDKKLKDKNLNVSISTEK
ncbi:MAG: AI-2E family transporter [Bacilli bacterium]|nr:AI-2E family transporter [Bacilli bacterium]